MTTTDTHETSLFHPHPSVLSLPRHHGYNLRGTEVGGGLQCTCRERRARSQEQKGKERQWAPPKEALESLRGEPPDPLSVLGAKVDPVCPHRGPTERDPVHSRVGVFGWILSADRQVRGVGSGLWVDFAKLPSRGCSFNCFCQQNSNKNSNKTLTIKVRNTKGNFT